MKIKLSSNLLFFLPAAIMAGVLIIYPIFYGFYLSFFETNLINKWNFVKLDNYIDLFKNRQFINSLAVNVKYIVFVVSGHFALGTWFAILLNKNIKGRIIFRGILLLPWLIPEVVYAIIWKWIMNPQYGIANHMLMNAGIISEAHSWFGDIRLALPMVAVVSILKGFPFVVIMVMAALQTVPGELYEAAAMDGYGRIKRFLYVTLPCITPVLAVALILDTVNWFKHFTMINVMTGGGPSETTSLLSLTIYETAFEGFNFGSAGAMAVIVFFICYFIGWIYRRLVENEN